MFTIKPGSFILYGFYFFPENDRKKKKIITVDGTGMECSCTRSARTADKTARFRRYMHIKTESNKEMQNGRGIPLFASYTVDASPTQKILISNRRRQKHMYHPAKCIAGER